MKIVDLRYKRTEQGRLRGSCGRSLCIICRSMRLASVWPLQFLQKRGVVESLTDNQALWHAQELRMNFREGRKGSQMGDGAIGSEMYP